MGRAAANYLSNQGSILRSEAFVTPNLGNTERWVPYHTILGVHELFLAQSARHAVSSFNGKAI